MKVHNVRMGYATNSSSSHSIILFPTAAPFNDYEEHGGYLWQDFLLTGKEEKRHYLAAQLVTSLQGSMPDDYLPVVINGLVGAPVVPKFKRSESGNYLETDGFHVDHQSVIQFPRRYGVAGGLHEEFFKAFRDHVLETPGVAVAGGNDNQSDDEAYDYGGTVDPLWARLDRDGRAVNLVARRDGAYWTLFNRGTGAKVRLSFDPAAPPYERSKYPELVDVKLTDRCPFADGRCPVPCYQESTPDAPHADPGAVTEVLERLAEMEVFEVAFGGGEPTACPYFPAALRLAYRLGIVPNFTTFHTGWVNNPKVASAVLECVGGFAISVNSREQFAELREFAKSDWFVDFTDYNRGKRRDTFGTPGRVSVQCVLGAVDTDFVTDLMLEMGTLREGPYYWHGPFITLLGFKSTGRGEGAMPAPVDVPRILQAARDLYLDLGMDTKAVNDHRAALDDAAVSDLLRTEREGVFSMYADAVTGEVAKDSYSPGPRTPFAPGGFKKAVERTFPFDNRLWVATPR